MTRPTRLLPHAAAAMLVLLGACSPGPNPNAKKVINACLAVSAADASAIVGGELMAYKMTGDDAPRAICEYNTQSADTMALIQLQKADAIKDTAADLASDQQSIHMLFKSDVKPPVTHPADGFGAAAFYANMTPRKDATVVQLHLIENGWKVTAVVNNPKDITTGEKQAATLVQKVFDSIQSGAAFGTI